MSLDFEWSPAKAAANARKHGVHFEEARTVFEDDEALLIPDPEHSIGEERFVLLGLSAALRVLVVVHCERLDGEAIRIISARKADRAERATYASRRS
ncbi:MAG: BrnT family toxin [Gemmatimonadaceae bacterium]